MIALTSWMDDGGRRETARARARRSSGDQLFVGGGGGKSSAVRAKSRAMDCISTSPPCRDLARPSAVARQQPTHPQAKSMIARTRKPQARIQTGTSSLAKAAD